MTILKLLAAGLLAALLGACASAFPHRDVKHSGSIVDYLFPNAKEAPQLSPGVTYLRPPVRVGLAFVPSGGRAPAYAASLAEAEKIKLLGQVKAAFAQHAYIGAIEIIPTPYLRPAGGFENMEQVARMFNVDVMAMVSYDQVQFNDSNALAFLYWTIIGAYVIHGDQYDVQTMLDISVFDVASHKLLFRAPGVSQVKGGASLANFSERSRAAQVEGYGRAAEQLIPQLQSELDTFKERIKTDAAFRVENRAGYRGGGAFGGVELALLLMLAGWVWVRAHGSAHAA
ncbi:MAG: rhombotarget lipoprotein [Betaproteobacteria bacterium]|nr:rhombotarget lipoprotein [Betaproteobacteria bacterium]